MENCQYEGVINCSEGTVRNKKIQWKPFLRQLLVCSGGWTSVFVYGFCMGGPTVFIPQLRKEVNSTNIITDDMASWLCSTVYISSLPCIVIVSAVANLFGKKITFVISAVSLLVGFIVLYYSSNITHIFISLIIHGLFSATQIVILIMIFTEYTSPNYRGLFLLFNVATCYCGIWAANAIGTFCNWKIIPLSGIVGSLYVVLTSIVWPESPYWLASKGKFEECATSHRWLKGCDEESKRELDALINLQKEYIAKYGRETKSKKDDFIDFWEIIKSKEFYKPTLISYTIVSVSLFSGKFLCAVYALDIIKQITNSESTAYIGMLILDGVTVFSMYAGCIMAKILSRRTLLLISSSVGAIFLFILSLYLYLIKLNILTENKYVSIVLLTAFSIAVGCGPLVMGHSFFGELAPIKFRNLSMCLVCLTIKTISAILLKITPLMFRTLGIHGFFLFFGICLSALSIILFKYLPETKDKTIQEIADGMKGSKTNEGDRISKLLISTSIQ